MFDWVVDSPLDFTGYLRGPDFVVLKTGSQNIWKPKNTKKCLGKNLAEIEIENTLGSQISLKFFSMKLSVNNLLFQSEWS